MFGIWRRGVAPAVFALSVPAVLVLLAAPAHAGELDEQVRKPAVTTFGASTTDLAPTEDLGSDLAAEEIEKVWAADYHPETDRWTERNNRIKISLYGSALFFGDNLRIQHDGGMGLRVSWEVPGFIGIRLDSTLVPWSHLRVRNANQTLDSGDHSRYLQGFVDVTSLSIAIFNPELSAAPNLAMWAGFGLDLWSYHYDGLIGSSGTSRRYFFVDFNGGGNLFFNLEYKILDVFHVGFEIREHIVYAPQTERGEFYKVDAGTGTGVHTVGAPHSRNQNLPIALSAVHEFQLHIAVLF